MSECLKKTVKFPQKILVWEAISIHGTSRLHIVDGTINQVKCTEVLQRQLLPQVKDWYGDGRWIFPQDSAPCTR